MDYRDPHPLRRVNPEVQAICATYYLTFGLGLWLALVVIWGTFGFAIAILAAYGADKLISRYQDLLRLILRPGPDL